MNWTEGGSDFWPGEYQKTYTYINTKAKDPIQAVFNGEVYNFRDLRPELEAAGFDTVDTDLADLARFGDVAGGEGAPEIRSFVLSRRVDRVALIEVGGDESPPDTINRG